MPAAPALDLVQQPERAAGLLHPLRCRLLKALREPDSAAGLARRMGMPRQKLNYHLREMEQQGLLKLVEERPRRGCTERMLQASAQSYLIGPGVLGDLAADPAEIQDHFSSTYQAAVAARALRELATLREGAEEAGQALATFTLDTEISFPSPAALQAFTDELGEAVAALVARHHDETDPQARRFRLYLGAHPKPKETHA